MKPNKQRLLAVVAPLLAIAFLFFGQINTASADSGQNQPEMEVVQTVVTTTVKVRKTYMAGSQPIAQRSYERDGAVAINDPAGRTNQQRHFIYTDHLGSASTVVNGADEPKIEQTVRFMPFGELRDGADELGSVTSRGFTGHRENRDIGLTYMNARFYLPGTGRFASADTIVPDPMNPQQFNRFSYVTNNPVRFNDPSGHCGADPGPQNIRWCIEHRDQYESLYNVTITGRWKLSEMLWLGESLELITEFLDHIRPGNGLDIFNELWSGVEIARAENDPCGWTAVNACARQYPGKAKVIIGDRAFEQDQIKDGVRETMRRDSIAFAGTVAHELAHIWDQQKLRNPTRGLREVANGSWGNCDRFAFFKFDCQAYQSENIPDIADNKSKQGTSTTWNPREDFAYTFQSLIVSPNDVHVDRASYIEGLVNDISVPNSGP